jgi:acyl-CoA synthetase (AMP-forming)/AMP-acid ligase II
METIPAVLAHAAAAHAGREALVGDGRRLTYAELFEEASEAAGAYVAGGLAPGDRVALWAPNGVDWAVAAYGAYLAGCVLVPLNSRYKGEEAGHVLRTSGARLLVTVTDAAGTDLLAQLDGVAGLDALQERVVLDEAPAGAPAGVPAGATGWRAFRSRATPESRAEAAARGAAVGPDDTSDIIFTSGTTGAPKGAMLAHGPSVAVYRTWADLVGLRADDRYLCVYPFFHTAGLKSGLLASLLVGAAVLPQAVFDVPTVMARVAEERVSMLPGPPTVFQAILDHPDLASFDLSSLRLSVTGAAVVPVSVVRRMRAELGFENVVTGYGLTETTGTVSMCRFDDPPEVIAETVGRPLPGVEVRVVDDRGADVAPGEPGEILVRGYNVMTGYVDDPAATAATIDPEGWLRTGDIGLVDAGGNIRITDRRKDMFIVGGFNAYPAEIEAGLLAHPAVAQVAVVGMPDHRLGEVGAAFVVPRAGAEVDEAEVIAWCRERMANFKVPRRVRVVDALPLTPSGKVQKFVLREALTTEEGATRS